MFEGTQHHFWCTKPSAELNRNRVLTRILKIRVIISQGYNLLRLFLNNFLRLFIPLSVVFGLFPFVHLTCTSYCTHLHP